MTSRQSNLETISGFTLIELMIALAIISILLGTALPSFEDHLNKQKMIAENAKLRGLLQHSRVTAIEENIKITVCPTTDQIQCNRDWSDGYMAFVDTNGDRALGPKDLLIGYNQIQSEKITLRWKAFGHKYSFQWHETGITNHQNGSFEFCFVEKPKLSRALIITKAGRIRASKDENSDEIHENSRGENLSC